MAYLTKSLAAWGSADFNGTLKREIEQLGGGQLPLQQGLTVSSVALDNRLEAMVLGISEQAGTIHARVGLFYTGMIAGCSCADDPTPSALQNEYCEVQIDIDKATAKSRITLLVW